MNINKIVAYKKLDFIPNLNSMGMNTLDPLYDVYFCLL